MFKNNNQRDNLEFSQQQMFIMSCSGLIKCSLAAGYKILEKHTAYTFKAHTMMAAALSFWNIAQCHTTVTKLLKTEETDLLGYDMSICKFTNILEEPAASIFKVVQELILKIRAANSFFRVVRTSNTMLPNYGPLINDNGLHSDRIFQSGNKQYILYTEFNTSNWWGKGNLAKKYWITTHITIVLLISSWKQMLNVPVHTSCFWKLPFA